MGNQFFQNYSHIKLEKINILILCCYYKTEIHYFQSPNFIDSVLNKTQNTKQRERVSRFSKENHCEIRDEKLMMKPAWGGWCVEATAKVDLA